MFQRDGGCFNFLLIRERSMSERVVKETQPKGDTLYEASAEFRDLHVFDTPVEIK